VECFDKITVLSTKHWAEMEIEFMLERSEGFCFVLICLNNLKHNVRLTSAMKLKKKFCHLQNNYLSFSGNRVIISLKTLACVMELKFNFDLGNEYRNIGSHPGGRFYETVQTGPRAHPTFYTMGTGSFPGVSRLGRGVDNPLHLAPRLKNPN
jgi:hypothetical protein